MPEGNTKMCKQFVYRGIGIACLAAALVAVVSAQAPRGGSDGLDQLLSEVRALRGELNQVAASSMRMQLLLARLSLQEQRIAVLTQQSAELQQQLATVTRDQSASEEHLARVTQALQDTAVPAEERRAAEYEIAALNTRAAERQQQQDRLQNQLDEVSRAVSAERGRWIEFNSRLDELEQSLPR